MNILLITAYFPPDSGSAANLFYDLGKKLAEKGHRVSVLTSFPSYHVTEKTNRYNGKKFTEEKIEAMTVFRVKVPQFPRYIPAMRALWQFTMSFCFSKAALKIQKHDIALIYSPPLPLGLTGSFIKRKLNTPFILNVQDLFPQSAIDLKILNNKLLIRFFEYLEEKIYSYSSHITSHSPGNQEHVTGTGIDRQKVTIIPNWIDTDLLKPNGELNPFRQKHNLQDKFVVSFAGVIGYSQDIDVIIKAADILKDRKDILFLIVGDGVEKKRLIKKAEDLELNNVVFLPMQPRDVYSQLLNASDVCLCTLKEDVLSPVVPSKILSIMAVEKPVIACMHLEGDAPKIIEEAKCGCVFAAGDYARLVEAILEMYESPELRKEYGKNGCSYLVNNFSLDTCSNNYIKLFEKVISQDKTT